MVPTGTVGLTAAIYCAIGIALGAGCGDAAESGGPVATMAPVATGGFTRPIGATGGIVPVSSGGQPGIDFPTPDGNDEFPAAGTDSAPPTASALFCDVLTISQQNCQSCHGNELTAGAPMSLVTHEDFMAPSVLVDGATVLDRVAARIHDAQRPMPPLPEALTAEQVATLDTWISMGGPRAECGAIEDPPVVGDTGDDYEHAADCEDTYQLVTSSRSNPNEPYVVGANSEEHPKFTFDAPWGNDEVQVVSSRPITDNPRVLHHWILYEGGGIKFLTGWAPGKEGTDVLPDNVGIYMPSGPRSLLLDVHYYNLGNDQAEPDQSGVELCVTRTFREFTATTTGLVGNATVPGNSKVDNVSQCTARVTPGSDVRFLAVSPHMHKLGINGKLELIRNGEVTVLHDQPFSFEDQKTWPLDDVQILDGDVLRTTCSFQNDSSRTVTFGQNSDDEMCFNFVTYYPMGELSCGFML